MTNRKLRDFFFASKVATSMMNLMTLIIVTMVVIVMFIDIFQQVFLWTTNIPLLTGVAIFCVLGIGYCIGTIVYGIFVYLKIV